MGKNTENSIGFLIHEPSNKADSNAFLCIAGVKGDYLLNRKVGYISAIYAEKMIEVTQGVVVGQLLSMNGRMTFIPTHTVNYDRLIFVVNDIIDNDDVVEHICQVAQYKLENNQE